VLASYDHPAGILGELVSQMADAFWWVKIYRSEKNNLVVSEMTDRMITKSSFDSGAKEAWVQLYEVLTKAVSSQPLNKREQNYLDEVLASEGQTLQSLRTDAFRFRRESFETPDRLIERQLKNVRLLMQSYDSVRFAPQVHKKIALELEQLELQVKQSREDQRLEVDRQ
jgi:energy-coupling factor transporter ATP-binding protein EcfA2